MLKTTVLLCDDSQVLRMVNASYLGEIGYELIGEAKDGIEALEQYKSLNPDIVLLDLIMPEKDGKQALVEILAHDKNARVIILSSIDCESDINTCLKAGAKSYLQKPVNIDEMKKVLDQVAA